MNGKEYLQRVVETIATYGNRDNDNFVLAFTLAQNALEGRARQSLLGPTVLEYSDLLRVDRQICQGLTYFNTGHRYFDIRALAAYQQLQLLFCNEEARWKAEGVR